MGLDRRGFVKFVVGGVAGTLFTPVIWKGLDDAAIWSQNWGWIPRVPKGEVKATPALSKLCPSGCAVKVKTVGGLPFAAIGNADNPMSKGGVCPICAGGAQLLYSPARVKSPMKKVGEGKFEAIKWEDAEAMLVEKLTSFKGQDGKIAAISGDETGTANEVVSALLSGLGNASGFCVMPGEMYTATKGVKLMGGNGQPGFDIAGADLVLMIGADALDSWGPSVANQKAFAASHPTGAAATAQFIYAGPVLNNTSSVCDKFLAVPPTATAAFSLALANALINAGAVCSASDFGDYKALAAKYTPEAFEKATGLKAEALKDLVARIKAAKAPLVIAGASFGQGAGALDFVAGASLNVLLGRVGQSGGMTLLPAAPKALAAATDRAEAKDAGSFLAQVATGKASPAVLLVYEANPAFALPQADAMAKALGNIAFKVSFSTYMDETATLADLILPAPHPYERFDDAMNPYGVAKPTYLAGKPAMAKPVMDVKDPVDVLLAAGSKLGLSLGFETYADVIKAKAQAVGADFDTLASGGAWTGEGKGGGLSLGAAALAKAPVAKADDKAVALAPVTKLACGTADLATPPANLLTIRDTELKGKDLFVQMNAATAKKLGVTDGNKVKLTGGSGEVRARVHVNEGVAADTVAMLLGFGHSAWDQYTKGKGDNVYKILTVSDEAGTGLKVWAGSTVTVAKI
ncbi:MAG: molybdopterin oxidoreductase [Desulfovibrionaceae bacterium CG1_02_65_16]|nr:MAG: molybdopterin oxidoreductase [Desulfovibrionaceae bacterium CG1_02_65_16]